ncbi:hypothetical protein BS17DRAFT_784338 [Gyrodon lividus]|nr:hypothetical protein BS17DRAFT_784338 [Gyrodon lividus]
MVVSTNNGYHSHQNGAVSFEQSHGVSTPLAHTSPSVYLQSASHHSTDDTDSLTKAIGGFFVNRKRTTLCNSSSSITAVPGTTGQSTTGGVSQTHLLRPCHGSKLILQVNTRHVAAHHPYSMLPQDHLASQLLLQPLPSSQVTCLTSQQAKKLGKVTKTMKDEDHAIQFLNACPSRGIQTNVMLGKRKAELLEDTQLPYPKADSNGHSASAETQGILSTIENTHGIECQDADTQFSAAINTLPTHVSKQVSGHTTVQPPAESPILLPVLVSSPGQINFTIPSTPPQPTTPTTPTYSLHLHSPVIIKSHGLPSPISNAPVTPVSPSIHIGSFPMASNLSVEPLTPKKPADVLIPKDLRRVDRLGLAKRSTKCNAMASSSQITLDDMDIDESEGNMTIDESEDDNREWNVITQTGFKKKVQEWANAVENIRHARKMMLEFELFGDTPIYTANGPELLDVLKEIDQQKHWVTYDEERVTGLASQIIEILRTCNTMQDTESIKLAVQIVDNFHQRFMGERFTWSAT